MCKVFARTKCALRQIEKAARSVILCCRILSTGNVNTIAGEGRFRRGKGDTKLSFFTDPVIKYNKCGLSYFFFYLVLLSLIVSFSSTTRECKLLNSSTSNLDFAILSYSMFSFLVETISFCLLGGFDYAQCLSDQRLMWAF